ncbi:MAG: hypothetical protein D6786_05570 [Gammaproteobacteria bacterium]|nr:MAG: hypothetical protein D6786_05570 [Gammaproteobacteria bacterium]
MKTNRLFALLLLVLPALSSQAGGENEVAKVEEAIQVLEEVRRIPEQSIPPGLLANAQAIAIIPGVVKAGFIVGGRYGEGVILRHDPKSGKWGLPVFMTLAGGSFGFQIGASSTDVILVFKNRRGLDNLLRGKFTLGADASVAAGPVGRQAEAATDAALKAEIYSYSRSRGLFAGIALDGSVLEIDHAATARFYGKPGLTAYDVFEGKVPKVPDVVRRLHEALK